ncbi:ion channel [Flavobacterium sp.]|uniref:ion channel n=1 Tax=Flavobacterium sp. TaxID=239 RepID=UPI0022BC7180|nr:ion channel [Flavobacterium sp.]MCZ8167506.1 ion channel [Flavobacterium sp.]
MWKNRAFEFRFEFLLLALVLLLFNKAFFAEELFFTQYIWPINMIVLGLASISIFQEQNKIVRIIKNILFLFSLIIPVFFEFILQFDWLTKASFLAYIFYYFLLFIEVFRQIFQREETNLSVILGSITGYLLLIVIAQFTFLLIEFNCPGSFKGITLENIPSVYYQLSYYSMVNMTTVGYGDITAATITARLSSMFFTILGQFYMVALVGIIVSRFTPKNK